MVSRVKRRRALRRKLHILRKLTCSNSVKKNCIIADAVLYIYNLKLHLEKIRTESSKLDAAITEHSNLMHPVHFPKREVKVEKDGEGVVVKVKCEKEGDNLLVAILEVFEGMGLMVLNASVSTNLKFEMEAIVVPEPQHQGPLDAQIVGQAIFRAIENSCK